MSHALAIDLGGTKVEAALISADGAILEGSRSRAATGATATSEDLEDAVRRVVQHSLAAAEQTGTIIIGVGIGSAGPINQKSGTVSPLNTPAWREYPLVDFVKQLVGTDIEVDLRIDGLCITLGDYWLGASRGAESVMGMIVSTGIGGGVVLGGRVAPSSTGNGGHIGHVEVGGHNDPCLCGGHGCVEAVASGPKTVAWAQSQGWLGQTGEDLARDYAAGNPIARAAVERSGRAIGRAIASATNVLDLDLVVIGGGFSKVTPDLFTFIRESIAERQTFPFVTRVRVEPSALTDDAPLLGAAALVHRPELVA
ncbi:MAG TPA: ROK family protein [Microbacteriaceae bacterium]|nr:ROK family protein [Microbacteriaceae bacterium]